VDGELTTWFYMAVSHECTVYNDDKINHRADFTEFVSDLLPLVEATYVYYIKKRFHQQNSHWPNFEQIMQKTKDKLCHDYSYSHLNVDQVADCESVFRTFCSKYRLEYSRLELWDFLEAVEFYAGPLRDRVSHHAFAEHYLKLLTLVEVAYVLTGEWKP
jgi:hypothetical protein